MNTDINVFMNAYMFLDQSLPKQTPKPQITISVFLVQDAHVYNAS